MKYATATGVWQMSTSSTSRSGRNRNAHGSSHFGSPRPLTHCVSYIAASAVARGPSASVLLVPLPADEASEGDQTYEGDDDPEDQAPEERDDDADDHENPANADAAGEPASAPAVHSHSASPPRSRFAALRPFPCGRYRARRTRP